MSFAWQYVEPEVRRVISIFHDMTVEEKGVLRDTNRNIFFALEHLESVVRVTDRARERTHAATE